MSKENNSRLTVISNPKIKEQDNIIFNSEYHSNPIYEKLLKFRNLQEQQKKKFSVDDLFKLC